MWWAFDWWRALAPGTVVGLTGDDPENGLWAIAVQDEDRIRVLVASFSVATPTDRRITIDAGIDPGTTVGSATVSRLRESGPQPPTTEPLGTDDLTFTLPANQAALVGLTVAATTTTATTTTTASTTAPTTDSPGTLPATGATTPTTTALVLLLLAATTFGTLRRTSSD